MRSYRKYGELHAARLRKRNSPTKLVVKARPGHPTQGILQWAGMTFPCALGRGGIKALKREGDGATPLGQMRLLYGLFRHDRTCHHAHVNMAKSQLAFRQTRTVDGWCDAPGDRNYNRLVRLPYRASCETMQRNDRLYDCVVVLDYNIRPCRRGRGSAIFFHIAREGFTPTEGCVAVSPQVMARLLPYLTSETTLTVIG